MTEKHQKHRTSLQSSSIPEKKWLEGKYEKTILPKIICQKSFAENHFAVNHGPKNKKHRARTTRWNREKLRKKKPAFQFFFNKKPIRRRLAVISEIYQDGNFQTIKRYIIIINYVVRR
jgi:hypothetical protein